MAFEALRQSVYCTAMMLYNAGLVRLSAGNVSARDANGHIAITPAGIKYDRLTVQDIVVLSPEGEVINGNGRPSSELPMHTTLMNDLPEVQAVVHTHSIYAIAFASSGTEIPVVSLEILTCGGPIPVAPYACPGTAQAGSVAVAMFHARPGLKVLLLRNHGLLAIGSTLAEAYEHAYNAETGAEVYYRALQLGTPIVLTQDQIDEVRRVYALSRT